MPDLLELMDTDFGLWFDGPSWNGWRSIVRGISPLSMSDQDIAFFKSVTGDRQPPKTRPREIWVAAGRRSGKDSIASAAAAHAAAFFDRQDKLRPGERALVCVIACDRDQARICTNYIRAFFELPALKRMVRRVTLDGFELINNVDVTVQTNSFRSPRGRPILLAILDEVAFFKAEDSATPDIELYRSLVPGLATLSGQIIGISSPYMKSGLLFEKHKSHFGQDNDDIVVIQAPTTKLNPTIDQAIIDQALIDDPASAAAEWLGEFRDDVSGFIPYSVVDSCVDTGTIELEPLGGNSYVAFLDVASGIAGRAGDSMALAIAHLEDLVDDSNRFIREVARLDLVREVRPPFQVDAVAREFATILHRYGVSRRVVTDRVGYGWVEHAFRDLGIRLKYSELTKSEVYLAALPSLGNQSVALLDNPRLKTQILNLERRVARGGHESVDHPTGNFHDDLANVALGALVEAFSASRNRVTWSAA